MPPVPPRAKPRPKSYKGTRKTLGKTSRKTGLRTAQIRILRALATSKGPIRKSVICSKVEHEFPTAAKFQEWMADPLGAADPANRPAAEKRAGYPSLLTLGYVITFQVDIDGVLERLYEITDAGRQALANLPVT